MNSDNDGLLPEDYRRSITAWLAFGRRDFHRVDEKPELSRYGPPDGGALTIEVTALYAFVHALVATDRDFDLSTSPLSRDECLDRALAAFRYNLATHVNSGPELAGEVRWGGTGMSPKMADQMALAAEVLGEQLPDADAERFAEVLCYEADANLPLRHGLTHVDHGYYRKGPPLSTGRFGSSFPESNAWRGCLLARALLAQPDAPHAERWREAMLLHFANSLTVPQDAQDDTVVDGKPMREWFLGANLHPHFALEHHGFFHPGYVNRAFLSLMSAYYAFRDSGQEPPEIITRHLPELWEVQRRLLLWDGRLAYPAGKDYPRYCWGMVYQLPPLVFFQNEWGERIARWAEVRLARLLMREQAGNEEGAFCSGRLQAWRRHIEDASPLAPPPPPTSVYYRVQIDPAFYLGLAYLWHRRGASVAAASREEVAVTLEEPFSEADCGLAMQRAPRRFASWSWNAHRSVAQGLVIPEGGDHLAEWEGNLVGRFYVQGASDERRVVSRQQHTFSDGFATLGTLSDCGGAIAHRVAFVALPDGRTTLHLSHATAQRSVAVLVQEGLRLNLANDLFNDNRRRLCYEGGSQALTGVGGEIGQQPLPSLWLNVDDLLGVVALDGDESFALHFSGDRNAYGYSLCYETVIHPYVIQRRRHGPGEILQHAAVALLTNVTPEQTQAWPTEHLGPGQADDCSRALTLRGMDDLWYLVAANFSDQRVEVSLTLPATTQRMTPLASSAAELAVVGGEARITLYEEGLLVAVLDCESGE